MKNFEEYKDDYLSFLEHKNYKKFASDIRDFDEYISLLHFAPLVENTEKIFLIIPSIFNSPDILSIGRPKDIITNLRYLGNVFLIDWKEIKNPNSTLPNYTDSICKLLSELSNSQKTANLETHDTTEDISKVARKMGGEIAQRILIREHKRIPKFDKANLEILKVDLIGHCFGGNLALATNVLKPELVQSLTLLSTPWDFTFLYAFREWHKKLVLDSAVRDLDYIPAIYFQILFFLMNQSSFSEKIDYYISNKSNVNTHDFFAIEKWQFSGHDLPRALYIELMDDIIGRNIMFNNMWNVDGKTIDPSVIKNPVTIVAGKKDRVVPSCASSPLTKIIQQYKKFEYNTGHIGYLVGSQKEHFMLDLINSLKIG